jgi:phosphatidate cytidylyltransferase
MIFSPELRTRALSALVLAAAFFPLTLWSELSFALLCAVASAILLYEWYHLTKARSVWFVPVGVVYIGAAAISLVYLRHESLPILLSVFVIVWTGDIAAYLVGRKFGRHKLAPAISPGKSWEGLGASILASGAVSALLSGVAPLVHALLGAAIAVIGLGGDLFESHLKRHAQVKDSGHLIPGHGGLFDRLDALLPAAIFAAIALYFRPISS